MDVVAVKEAAAEALARIRAGKGPYILEMMTYRYRGHSMSDPAKYRSREEVRNVRAGHDPIENVRHLLIDKGMADEAALKAIDAESKLWSPTLLSSRRTALSPTRPNSTATFTQRLDAAGQGTGGTMLSSQSEEPC